MKKNINDEWIDIHNDALMVSLGLRQPKIVPRDSSIWTKTKKEKDIVKKMKNSIPQLFTNKWGGKKNIAKYKGKLYIVIEKNDAFTMYDSTLKRRIPQTIFTFNCYQYNIPFILLKFIIDKKNLIKKVTFDGKPYSSIKLS